MNALALLLAVAAAVCFLMEYRPAPRRPLIALGLAFLTAALIVQLIWQAHLLHVTS